MENPDAEEHTEGLNSPGHEEGTPSGETDKGSRTAEDAAEAELALSSECPSNYVDPVNITFLLQVTD